MVKHWAQSHGELNEAPLFKFEVVKQHKDSLSRMLHEALLIEKEANLNSKSEFRSNRLTRLVIEAAPWEEKKVACAKAQEEKAELGRILQLKHRYGLQGTKTTIHVKALMSNVWTNRSCQTMATQS